MKTLPSYRTWLGRPRHRLQSRKAATCELVAAVREEQGPLSKVSSQALAKKLAEIRGRVGRGERVASSPIAVTAFALTAEALRRVTGKSFFDVQLTGGFALAAGAVAEIQTGEGKTIIAALPTVLRALEGRGVHVATTNAYLSHRDYEQLRPVFETLGLTAGLIRSDDPPEARRRAYACDITYAAGYEFAFDFLRDQLALRAQQRMAPGLRTLAKLRGDSGSPSADCVQRGHGFAVIDEADSVLVDEAITPLIIGGASPAARTDPAVYKFAHHVAEQLQPDRDFSVDANQQEITFSDLGWHTVHSAAGDRPPGRLAVSWFEVVENAVRAIRILERDADYVVIDNRVVIVDQNTGRLHEDRKWRRGLHQAVEVKEGVEPTIEQQTEASVTRQRFSRLYTGMCGMTGTAQGAGRDFCEFYGLPVVVVPTNRPCQRERLPSQYFATLQAKYEAVAREVHVMQRAGRPVLVGTETIHESREVSLALAKHGVAHTVLNGLQDADEASLVAHAGRSGSVTVATNMAGRGTDIQLDPAARASGGLHVVTCQFHASRRVDRQLAGRAARQGDAGSFQHFVSAQDELFQRVPGLADQIRDPQVNADKCDAKVARHQHRLERESFHQRQLMVAHDNWLETVRSSLASTR